MAKDFWFGTLEYMQYIDTPVSGADMSPVGFGEVGVTINGGGYAYPSFGSHKSYTFDWSGAAAVRAAQLMKSYSDGTYGRGLIYFQDPLSYDQNILPARVADPSMANGTEGASMVYGLSPTSVMTSGWQKNGLPVNSAYYNLTGTPAGFRGREHAVYVPIPDGFRLFLGAYYSYTGSGGVFVNRQLANGTVSSTLERVTPRANDADAIVNTSQSWTDPGVWLWFGRSTTAASTLTATALIGRLVRIGAPSSEVARIERGPWVGGMGHSGCRFNGKPSYVANSGVNGGQVGYAASFIETGSWAYG